MGYKGAMIGVGGGDVPPVKILPDSVLYCSIAPIFICGWLSDCGLQAAGTPDGVDRLVRSILGGK